MHLASELGTMLFLAGLGVMARASVADEEAFLGWLFLLAVAGAAGASGGRALEPATGVLARPQRNHSAAQESGSTPPCRVSPSGCL